MYHTTKTRNSFDLNLRSLCLTWVLLLLTVIPGWSFRAEDKKDSSSKARVATVQALKLRQDPFVSGFQQQKKAPEVTELSRQKWIGFQLESDHPSQQVLKRLNASFASWDASVRLVREQVDFKGNRHIRLQQYYKNYLLVGSQLIVHVNAKGLIYALTGRLHQEFTPANQPVLSLKQVEASCESLMKSSRDQKILSAQLVILDDMLAWEVKIGLSESEPGTVLYVDAETGEVLHESSLKMRSAPSGNGAAVIMSGERLAGEDGSTVEFSGWKEQDGPFFLYSLLNKWGVYDEDQSDWSQWDLAELGPADPAAISLSLNMEKVQTYVAEVLNRNSYNDAGTLLRTNVHVGDEYVNAYWNGSTLNFGDGDGVRANALTVLDVVAHEFGHAITQYTSDLVYSYESGALNESYSDITGVLVEFWAQPDGRAQYPGSLAGHADWLMGEDCWLESAALRDMRDPQRYEQPSYYQGTYWATGSSDDGGVHTNSGVQNFAFYLLAEGGSGTNGGRTYDLTGLGIEVAGQIAMYANMYLLTSSAQYQDAREAWILAANTLGYDAQVVADVWTAVGVLAQEPQLVLDPQVQNVGVIALQQAYQFVFTFRNDGNASALLNSLTFNQPDAEILTTTPVTVPGGNTALVYVRWTPAVSDTFEWTLTAQTSDPNAPELMGTVTGRVGEAAEIQVTPASLHKELQYGDTGVQYLQIQNHGAADLVWTLEEYVSGNSMTQPYIYGPEYFGPELKGDLGLQGQPVTTLSGGPDEGGYRWVDSDENGGPVYAWNSISATGTRLSTVSSCDDCYEAINTSFTLYDVTYPNVYVSSNGYVTLSSGASSYTNYPIPSSNAPATLIAPFWDDLYPSSSGDVYYEIQSDRLVVEWNAVKHYSSSVYSTFQVHLLNSGIIEFYYNSLGSTTSVTVGIQNQSQDVGLQVVYNTSYLKNQHAVRIQKNTPWLELPVTSGTLSGGESVDVPVHFNAVQVTPGSYSSNLRITHNVDNVAPIDIPVELISSGCKSLELSAATVDFDSVMIGASARGTVTLINHCSEATSLLDVQNVAAPFSLQDSLPVVVQPGDTQSLTFSFTPEDLGLSQGLILLESDADENSVRSLTLLGTGLPASVAHLDPTYLLFQMDPADSPADQVSVLSNLGGSSLEWRIVEIRETARPSMSLLTHSALPAVRNDLIYSAENLKHEYVKDRVIVGLKQGQTQFAENILSDAVIQGVQELARARRPGAQFASFQGRKLLKVSFDAKATTVEKMMELLRQDEHVAYVEPDYILYADLVPNDPSFSRLYGMHNTGQTGGTADADIDAPEAWDQHQGGESIVIGVIDTGIDYNHPDLVDNIWTNPGEIAGNGIDDDGNGYVDDIHGYDFVYNDSNPMDGHYHGTHCAGTIAARGNNGIGVVGVMWRAKLMALKFLNDSGSGSTSDAVDAVAYANAMGASMTSNSWGGGSFSQALYDVIAAGGLFVAAAGNKGTNNDSSPHYPSSYSADNVLAVAATDDDDALASFSCYGATSVDLAAPGVNIYSTSPSNSYRTLSGTSMATPHVAGAAGLIWTHNPSMTALQVKEILMQSVDSVAALNGKVLTGGRLNVASALSLTRPNYIRVAPEGPGSIQGGSSENIVVTVDPEGLLAGLYQNEILIETNDPLNPLLTLDVDVEIAACRDLTIDVDTLDFGAILVGDSATREFIFSNACNAPTTVELNNLQFSQYTVQAPEPLVVPAGGQVTVNVVLTPTAVEDYNDVLSWTSNADQNPVTSIALVGRGAPVPGIQVSPDSVERSVVVDHQATAQLTITNTGGADLEWSLENVSQTQAMQNLLAHLGTMEVSSSSLGSDQETESVPSISMLSDISLSDVNVLIIRNELAWGYNVNVPVLDSLGASVSVVSTSSLATVTLSDYDYILVEGDQSSSFYTALSSARSRLEEYVQQGGKLQMNMAASSSDHPGGFVLPGQKAVLTSSIQLSYTDTVQEPNHPIFNGMPQVFSSSYSSHAGFVELDDGVTVLTQGEKGYATTIEYSLGLGRVFATGLTLEHGYYNGKDFARALPNIAAYIITLEIGIDWLSADKLTGTVVAGDSEVVTLTLDATGMEAGTYREELMIRHNAPQSQVSVPVTLIVTDLPVETYTIISSATAGGRVSPAGSLSVAEGDSVTYHIVADSGYYLVDVEVDSVSVGALSSYDFLNVTSDHAIHAVFAPIPHYTIISSATEGGSISPLDTLIVAEGDSVTYHIVADSGYYLVDVEVDSVSVGALSSYDFLNVTSDHAIHAVFAEFESFEIVASASWGAHIAPAGTTLVTAGDSLSYAISVDTGYVLVNVFVDGVPVGAVDSYEFANVSANHSIEVVAVEESNGECEVNPVPQADHWVFLNAWNDASSGSHFDNTDDALEFIHRQWGKPDGWLVQNGLSYSFEAGVQYELTFQFKNDNASPVTELNFALASGTLWDSPIIVGTTLSVTGNLNSGNDFQTLSVQFEAPATGQYYLAFQQKWSAQVATESHVFYRQFSLCHGDTPGTYYTISAQANSGGTMDPASVQVVSAGDSITYTMAADSGYRIADVLVDGISVGAVSSYAFHDVQANHMIEVVFEAMQSYEIESGAGMGGSISPLGVTHVASGDSVSYQIVADSGYVIYNVLVDGLSMGPVSSYLFTDVQSNHSIIAEFDTIPVYEIESGAGMGGSISPLGVIRIVSGDSVTYQIVADSGYVISDVLVDGVSVGAVSSYLFSDVQSNHSIIAEFDTIPVYEIESGAGMGGSISPLGLIHVVSGDSVSYQIIADSGYVISDVLVDGVSVGAVSSYLFSDVQSNHSIIAEFEEAGDVCNEETALALGGFSSQTNVPANACVKISEYPGWWNNSEIRLVPGNGGSYPIPFEWQNCSQTGTGTFTQSWADQYLEGVSKTCVTLIQLQGDSQATVNLYWY